MSARLVDGTGRLAGNVQHTGCLGEACGRVGGTSAALDDAIAARPRGPV
ncbi:hypothetical protein [Cellulomonas wangsupingiae]|uniref:Uncharacterized protein n=1 Tax=Cellulomonas wangsupingiae TaxID=2968085 RepID=A0ABY5K8V4_9CELL|nr:hypothetical protein [Cellulomonas wangsupingiae]MCC2334538.1 hypothetical protein [Cellulomonas wangsupingiae]UUI66493.1 hypothetical protein NP075_07245 [Cellulomonas wangsupingiae]